MSYAADFACIFSAGLVVSLLKTRKWILGGFPSKIVDLTLSIGSVHVRTPLPAGVFVT